MKVDNGIKVWALDGSKPYEQAGMGELYQVSWRPAAPGVFPPPPDPAKYIQAGTVAAGQPKPVGAYKAPGRATAGGGGKARTLAELAGESGSRAGKVLQLAT